jgi:hypothetical protein
MENVGHSHNQTPKIYGTYDPGRVPFTYNVCFAHSMGRIIQNVEDLAQETFRSPLCRNFQRLRRDAPAGKTEGTEIINYWTNQE